MSFSLKVAVGNGRSINGLVAGSFELNGASAPDSTKFGGDIIDVTRETQGAVKFFRVTFRDSAAYQDKSSGLHVSAFLANGLIAVFAHAMLGAFVADSDSSLPDTTNQVDVIVRDAAGADIDTAGVRINVGGLIKI